MHAIDKRSVYVTGSLEDGPGKASSKYEKRKYDDITDEDPSEEEIDIDVYDLEIYDSNEDSDYLQVSLIRVSECYIISI